MSPWCPSVGHHRPVKYPKRDDTRVEKLSFQYIFNDETVLITLKTLVSSYFNSKDILKRKANSFTSKDDGSGMISNSGNDIIFVAMNYRVGA